MDLIQENGKPRYGRFESVPSTIHVQHYICLLYTSDAP
ncbi:hypothetical protein, partial [Acinetobacter baumannii]